MKHDPTLLLIDIPARLVTRHKRGALPGMVDRLNVAKLGEPGDRLLPLGSPEMLVIFETFRQKGSLE